VSANVAGAVTRPGAPTKATGFTVTGTGVGDAGFSVNAAFAGGTMHAGHRNTRVIVAQSTTATGSTANTIAITHKAAIHFATRASTLTDTFSYIVTPNYN
jgi:hypothetical protein